MKDIKNIIKYGYAEDEKIEFLTKHISIIGENGSGKSSLMRKIKQQNHNFTIISAHKNLTIKQGSLRANDDQNLADYKSFFSGPNINNHNLPITNNCLQDDFNQNIEILLRDHTSKIKESYYAGKTITDKDRQVSNLERVIECWNSIFVDKEIFEKDKFFVKNIESKQVYDIENLSDGERSALYILMKIVLADSTSTIIIDEPETFLNPAILDSLFDECEKLRVNCSFIYFSHNLEFITTRKNNTIFWIKNFAHPDKWEIDPIESEKIPEEVMIKIVGTKKQKILFVESNENHDSKLYQLIYPEFKVMPVGGCENVINYTRALNLNALNFNKQYFGLIDRDLKFDKEIEELKDDNIFCLPVAIYENLFLHKEIIKFVFNHLGREDFETKFEDLKTEVREIVKADNFELGYIKSKIKQSFDQDIESIAKGEKQFEVDFNLYKEEITALRSDTYEGILRTFNQKNLKGCTEKKLGYKYIQWKDQILNIFNTDKSDSFRKVFLNFMPGIG